MDESNWDFRDLIKLALVIFVIVSMIKDAYLGSMPSGANEMLTRIEVEGHSIDIPADYTSFNQDENQVIIIIVQYH